MIDQEEIHHQCLSDDPKERIKALEQLEGNFSLLLDKQQAWEDLHKLTNDEDKNVSYWTASALGSAFSHVPDKQQAWNDLHRLIIDQDNFMRFIAVDALGSAFSHIPDKQQAWDELIELLTDGDIDVEYSAASALSSAFPHVSDKQQAWNDLIKLTIDEDYAGFFLTHSLGKVSIFKASQAEKEEDYKKELEKQLSFLKKNRSRTPYGVSGEIHLNFAFLSIVLSIQLFSKNRAQENWTNTLQKRNMQLKGQRAKSCFLKLLITLQMH